MCFPSWVLLGKKS
uniref:Uncharacterized protein n=1 Tax=Anguilla anguilla TaxID=7936 RepID=A0A0E9VGM4_ANGAN